MRLKRYKSFRKTLRFYRVNFNLQEPFHVLIDGTFILQALRGKVHIKEQLPKILGGKMTPMVTPCTLNELRNIGDKASGASIIAKGYYRLKCHHKDPIGARECIESVIGEDNDRRFLVATNDDSLRSNLRKLPCCPLLFLRGEGVPVLEEPNQASRWEVQNQTAKKQSVGTWERPKLKELQRSEDTRKAAKEARESKKKKKKRSTKGVNPLSCKKKKKKHAAASDGGGGPRSFGEGGEGAGSKRKRTRSRRQRGSAGASSPNGVGDEPTRKKSRRDVESSPAMAG